MPYCQEQTLELANNVQLFLLDVLLVLQTLFAAPAIVLETLCFLETFTFYKIDMLTTQSPILVKLVAKL